jgi:LmbE family N-acetylglucosaminyl deacetylase
MRWIYLSPHYDDAIFSCGGLIWEQVRAGETVEIWTIFSGNPPPGPLSAYALEHHERWGVADSLIALRRTEDQAACAAVGAAARYYDLPDCIYRRLPNGEALIKGRSDLFGTGHPDEAALISFITKLLDENLQPADRLVCPLTVGGHVDHRVVRSAVEALPQRPGFMPITHIPSWKNSDSGWNCGCQMVPSGCVTHYLKMESPPGRQGSPATHPKSALSGKARLKCRLILKGMRKLA